MNLLFVRYVGRKGGFGGGRKECLPVDVVHAAVTWVDGEAWLTVAGAAEEAAEEGVEVREEDA